MSAVQLIDRSGVALPAPHPATYTESLFPVFAEMLAGADSILDPMAGTGKIFKLRDYGITAPIYANELQPRWACWHPETHVGDATALPLADNSFGAICVSPAFGNRMSDHHNARDKSKRNTYRHYHGEPLHPNNSGAMPWGPKYWEFHKKAWMEARRVLRPGGPFVLDIKDFLKTVPLHRTKQPYFRVESVNEAKGKAVVRVLVTRWHCDLLEYYGFAECYRVDVPCPGNRQGANGQQRIDTHTVIKFRKATP